MSEEIANRDATGKFLPGCKPHPNAGRPKGKTQADLIRVKLEPERERLVERLMVLAFNEDGNVSAKAVESALSWLVSIFRVTSEFVNVPGYAEQTTLQGRAEAIISAIATGEVSAQAGQLLMQILDAYSRVITASDLEKRMAALEAGAGRVIPGEARDITDVDDLI